LALLKSPDLQYTRVTKNIYAQIIDDTSGSTIVSCSTIEKDIRATGAKISSKESAKVVGSAIAKKALDKNIKQVVFDRSGYPYHGKIKVLADAAREAGLEF